VAQHIRRVRTDDNSRIMRQDQSVSTGEESGEIGRLGVNAVKRWLEATMRFQVPYTVYDNAVRVTLPLVNGSVKKFDMLAHHYDSDQQTLSKRDIYVEVKTIGTLKSARKQTAQYKEFVATAYSATKAAWLSVGRDPTFEFMWATRHPWEVEHFLELTTPSFVESCVGTHAGLIGDEVCETPIAQLLADRLWVWHIPSRQDEMTMGPRYRGYVLQGVMGSFG
jgi:hypothetical protein